MVAESSGSGKRQGPKESRVSPTAFVAQLADPDGDFSLWFSFSLYTHARAGCISTNNNENTIIVPNLARLKQGSTYCATVSICLYQRSANNNQCARVDHGASPKKKQVMKFMLLPQGIGEIISPRTVEALLMVCWTTGTRLIQELICIVPFWGSCSEPKGNSS